MNKLLLYLKNLFPSFQHKTAIFYLLKLFQIVNKRYNGQELNIKTMKTPQHDETTTVRLQNSTP